MRICLYSRVSTEDQARYGLSIEAQQAALRDWAQQHGHEVVGEYTDAGISGRKPYKKRPELSRFMSDLESGLQVDALVFTKLDRFYRSVKLYYEAVAVLERHRVAWIAIQEDYETVTASGRFKVNIMLSVAENEADRTSERIKSVFEHKVDVGQVLTRSHPIGFKVEDKRLVHDENAPVALAVFEHFAEGGNLRATQRMLDDQYGIKQSHEMLLRMLRNTLYVGSYRGNDAFCEPIVPRPLFDKVQDDLERRRAHTTPARHTYIFSGLIVCGECGRRMVGTPGNGYPNSERYRCPGYYGGKTCENSRTLRELNLEVILVDQIAQEIAGRVEEQTIEPPPRPAINRAAIQRKLERLKALYLEGDIELAAYRQRRDELAALLAQDDEPQRPEIRTVVGDDFEEHYVSWSKEARRIFWRQIVDHVTYDSEDYYQVFWRT